MTTIPMETAPGAKVVRQPSTAALPALNTSVVDPVVGHSIDEVRTEIDEMIKDMRTFYNREPDDVFRLVAGHSARLAELRVRIGRVENVRREWGPVRTREIELVLTELGSQYQMASRRLSARELDWKMETGAR